VDKALRARARLQARDAQYEQNANVGTFVGDSLEPPRMMTFEPLW
jgi:hypothetical protein